MNTTRKQFTIYMICAFGIAYVIQLIASTFANSGNTAVFQLLMMGVMYIPFLSVLIARIPLKGMGWKPHLKGKIRYVLLALWTPAVLSIIGGVLFFFIFPNTFDPEFGMVRAAAGEEGMAMLEAQGLTLQMYMVSAAIQAVTWAPFFNMIMALGEEVGWRGAMYPYLKAKLGVTKGRILGGVLWGVWHWPVIILAGYEYGKDYFGAPFLGPILFCIFAAAAGILLDYLYDKTECIWIPSLFHGAMNAFTLFAYMLKPECQNYMILGPVYIGIISGIPLVLAAVFVSVKKNIVKEQGI